MTFRIQLAKNEYATLISAYVPTLNAEDVDKEAFYSQLDNALSAIHKDDKIILLGDFNARVGKDSELWTGIIGKEEVGKANSNGTLLLSKCTEHNLEMTNTLFGRKIGIRSPGNTQDQSPGISLTTSSRDQQDVLITRALTGTDECWTNHRLITSIMKVKLRPKGKHHGKADSKRAQHDPKRSKGRLSCSNSIPDDVRNAIKAIKNNKEAGPDGIPTEIYKSSGDAIQHQLHQLLTKIWINEDVPSDFRDANIITIYKRKGDRSECGNYRGISLLANAGKLLARILNNRLKTLSERILPETQAGFRPAARKMSCATPTSLHGCHRPFISSRSCLKRASLGCPCHIWMPW
ncbi:uncharacterized protein LOC143018729 [Oratosquilla oratoria]|uniref:uncharacterized protein LOC143018729 n=1 Tax=Oratosquilla oratoria TaxID=337810 RepID=UPI003F76A07B